jgi:hypothetical protein
MRGSIALAGALAAVFGVVSGHAADMPVKAPAAKAPSPVGGGLWAEAEYLYWQAKGDTLPALITTGVLGAPGTSVLFGGSTVNQDWRSGVRLRAGYWLDPNRTAAVEAQFFTLENASTNFFASSNGAPPLARPFFNTAINAPDALLIASPGITTGQISANDTSRLLGAGIAFRKELCAACAIGSVSGIVGYRYLRLHDQLGISSTQNAVGFPAAFAVTDQFDSRNDFHGLDLGVTGLIANGPWKFEWLAKAAVGATLTDISINGSTVTTAGGTTTAAAGGLLALPTNIVSFGQDRISVVPELSARLGYQITPQLRAFAGYNFIYWTGVVRPGGIVDTTVNPTQLPPGALVGAARPAPRADPTDYWVHGVNVGVAFNF